MASPILKAVPQQLALNLGAFPARPDDGRGETAARIKASITISMLDRRTGEKFTRFIPFFTDESSELVPWLQLALEHERTKQDVEAFATGRDG